ncbi:hypothetical protein Ppa06_61930 [Planomonospora parontospora subsp. parontospora]|uniref:Uncharacterized protein n=2 Tax=Planomonospora parontospora TaxID=58119 RepID=A0AA37F811_9ACTN|nr:hypothetical protein [Planomonospora parontospora]GGK93763.1 hypothetical protein GCM10010126_61400 [Planomonospora parontospora]GII12395.1 hypothetical protein Ppa06_61930 [Planomonospora parontospora subsp. parontospora]
MTAHDVARLLPDVPVLRDLCRSMAVLEAILSPDWESRYHSLDAAWSPGEEMASMCNGSGEEYSIVFSAAGAYVRGFAHYRRGRRGRRRLSVPYDLLSLDPVGVADVVGIRHHPQRIDHDEGQERHRVPCGEEPAVDPLGDRRDVHAGEEVAQCAIEGEQYGVGSLQDLGDMRAHPYARHRKSS